MQIGFCGLLTIIFVIAKLMGALAWSWFWVFSPIWIPFVLMLLFMIVGLVITVLAH